MTFARAQRPASVVLAATASVLLLLGLVPAGAMVGALGVVTAWLPARSALQPDLQD